MQYSYILQGFWVTEWDVNILIIYELNGIVVFIKVLPLFSTKMTDKNRRKYKFSVRISNLVPPELNCSINWQEIKTFKKRLLIIFVCNFAIYKIETGWVFNTGSRRNLKIFWIHEERRTLVEKSALWVMEYLEFGTQIAGRELGPRIIQYPERLLWVEIPGTLFGYNSIFRIF